MTNVSAAKIRNDFSNVVNRVAFGKERFIINRRGKNLAAVIPVEDLELLQKIEDGIDLIDARNALKEARTKGTKFWSTLKTEIGL